MSNLNGKGAMVEFDTMNPVLTRDQEFFRTCIEAAGTLNIAAHHIRVRFCHESNGSYRAEFQLGEKLFAMLWPTAGADKKLKEIKVSAGMKDCPKTTNAKGELLKELVFLLRPALAAVLDEATKALAVLKTS